jgi:hypothetical protein
VLTIHSVETWCRVKISSIAGETLGMFWCWVSFLVLCGILLVARGLCAPKLPVWHLRVLQIRRSLIAADDAT